MKNIEIIVDNQIEDSNELFTDSKRLKQILFNLIGNSIKFTSIGSIKLTVKDLGCCNDDIAYHQIQFQVKDTGLGIKQEDIPKLFKMFGKLGLSQSLN